jgi:hypothetical protein
MLVFGTFNRITFPAFVMVPLVQLAMKRYNDSAALLSVLT